MSVSTRISIQWLPENASEPTETFVVSSRGGHFVDIRNLRDTLGQQYANFHYDWAISGHDEVLGIDPTTKLLSIKFHHELDSKYIVAKSQSLNDPSITDDKLEQLTAPDVGHFKTLENGDRHESGEMMNADTGKITPYIEIWRSLDALTSTPKNLIRETEDNLPKAKSIVFVPVDESRHKGKLVRFGNWIQALITDESKGVQPDNINLTVLRAVLNEGNHWVTYNSFGDHLDQFPLNFEGAEGETFTFGGVEWKVIENS